jgi:TetR/AcrR family transcriptional repressor of nem operon
MARPRQFDEGRVLDAAMRVFWQRGYQGTSAQDLVNATGLSRSSLYNTYSSKQALFERALEHYQHRTREFAALLNGDAPVKDRIRRLLETAVSASPPHAETRGCLVTNTAVEAGHRPQTARLVRKNFQTLQSALELALERAKAKGEFSTTRSPADLALYFLTTLQGLRVMANVTPPRDQHVLLRVIDISLNEVT